MNSGLILYYINIICLTSFSITLLVLLWISIKRQQKLSTKSIVNNIDDYKIQLSYSPIVDLTYEDALIPDKFDKKLVENALVNLNMNFLFEFGTKDLSYINNITSSIKRLKNGNIVWNLSDKGKKLLKSGKAELVFHNESGKLLPMIKDQRTGKFVEQFKGKMPNVGSKIANLSNVVVNVAHIIAGADISNKLKSVDKKVDLLIAGRRIDQMSRIESNYLLARELLSGPLSENDISTLKLLHKEIMELRSAWRQEIELKLSSIEDPNNIGWLKKMFTRQQTRDRKVISGICEFEKEIRLIGFSLSYDLALCQVIGNSNTFINITLPDEIIRLNRIKVLVEEKTNFISGYSNDEIVRSVNDYFGYICEKYSTFIPVVLPQTE